MYHHQVVRGSKKLFSRGFSTSIPRVCPSALLRPSTLLPSSRNIVTSSLLLSPSENSNNPLSESLESIAQFVPETDDDDPLRVPGSQQDAEKYVMMYTCKKCNTRSARQITKQSYHHGTVVVRCPGCGSLHLIADHLGWFEDNAVDAESYLKKKGEVVRRASLDGSIDGNVIELTEGDLKVLRSSTKSVNLNDGSELEVAKMENIFSDPKTPSKPS